jgi:hypothetical protein
MEVELALLEERHEADLSVYEQVTGTQWEPMPKKRRTSQAVRRSHGSTESEGGLMAPLLKDLIIAVSLFAALFISLSILT